MDELSIVRNFFIVSNKMKRLLDKYHQKNGIYLGQARLLSFLYRKENETIYQKTIEDTFQLRGGTVTGMIDSLVKLNYIKRIESTTDKRKKKIVLTETGKVKGSEAIKTIKSFEENISNLFNNEEKELLNDVFLKVNKYIDEEENI